MERKLFINFALMQNLFLGKIGRLHFLLQCFILQSLTLVAILGILFLAGFTSLFETFLSYWLIDQARVSWPALLLIATLPATVKRLRDLDWPIFLAILTFVPVVQLSALMYLVLLFYPGKK